jgi:hypothetical protein
VEVTCREDVHIYLTTQKYESMESKSYEARRMHISTPRNLQSGLEASGGSLDED